MKTKPLGARQCRCQGQASRVVDETLTGPVATLSQPMGEGLKPLLTKAEVAGRLRLPVRGVTRLPVLSGLT